MQVLVAEDDAVTALMLQFCLEQYGYGVTVVDNGLEALELVRTGEFQLVISDWSMPKMTGVDCRQIRKRPSSSYTYIILLTTQGGTKSVVEGLEAGADDFITKPFQPEELHVRLRAGERLLTLESRDITIFALAKLAESRDPETGAHFDRIREYYRVLCEHLVKHMDRMSVEIDGDYVRLVYLTSPLHDIGKVGIPDHVLLKPGPLTAEEFAIMQQHALIGGETLNAALQTRPDVEYLRMARDIAFSHHEKYDGSGYPHGIKADEIPLCGRIVALADVYDALTTKRVYKAAFSHEKARSIILEGSGRHFDPAIVDAFLANEGKFIAIRDRLADADAAPEADAPPRPDVTPGEAERAIDADAGELCRVSGGVLNRGERPRLIASAVGKR